MTEATKKDFMTMYLDCADPYEATEYIKTNNLEITTDESKFEMTMLLMVLQLNQAQAELDLRATISHKVVTELFKLSHGLKGDIKVLQLHWMLYPEYAYLFDKTISPAEFKRLQEEARELLLGFKTLPPETAFHLESIANGQVPFGWSLEKEADF